MKSILRRILFFTLFPLSIFSQTSLSPGDMAFIGFNTSNDAVAVVTFVNLCPGTVFYFTDNPYRNSSGFCTSGEEFCIKFTVNTTVAAGTKITYVNASHPSVGAVNLSPTGGSISAAYAFTSQAGTNDGFNSGGDNGFIFQGSYTSPSFVCGFKNSGTWNSSGSVNCGNRDHSELPNTLTLGQNAMVGCVDVSMKYNCSILSGSAATLGVAINNVSRWTCSGGSTSLPPSCNFTVTGVTNPLPVVSATASPISICNGSTLAITASGATTYTWSSNAGSAVSSSVSVSPTSNITYTITGNVSGCTDTETVSVVVTPLPTLTVSAAPTSVCAGQSTTLTANGATSYTWSSNAGSALTNTAAVSPTANTTYTVTGSNNGCPSTKTISVGLSASPSLTVSGTTTVCAGQSVTLNATGATSYTWNPGTVTTSSINLNPSSSNIYTVTGNSGGCIGMQTVSLDVIPLPTLTVTPSSSLICSGNSVSIDASGATTYTWSANAGAVSGNSVTVSPSGNTTYTVTGSNSGCSNTQTVSVDVTSAPTILASASQTILCPGQSSVLSAFGATTYTWSTNAGSVNTESVTVTPGGNETYTVTGANGNCVDSTTVSVIVSPTPSLTVSASVNSICTGNSSTLSASGAGTYTWEPGSASGSTITVSPSANQVYTVTGGVSGCISQQTISISVNQLPVLAALSGQTLCAGASVNSIAFSANGANVNWTNNNPNIGLAGSGSGNIASYTSPLVSVEQTGIITAVPVNTLSGCTGSSQSCTVVIHPKPVLGPAITDSALCGLSNGSIHNASVSGGTPAYTYQWYSGGQAIPAPGGTGTNLSGLTPGTYSLVVTDAMGCTTAGVSYTVNGSPAVVTSFTANPLSGQPPLNVLCSNGSTGATSYAWDFGNGTGSSGQDAGTIYNSPGTYTIILLASNGICQDTAMAVIQVEQPVVFNIPNVFSPNGDLVNDHFYIQCTGMETLNCDIFNRWGQKMKTITGLHDSWDGVEPNGAQVPDGTYFYIFSGTDLAGKTYAQQGYITLVR